MSSLLISCLIQLAQRDYELNGCPYALVFPSQSKHVTRELGDLPASSLTFDDVERYKLSRIQAGAARETINKELKGIKKGYRIAVDARILPSSEVPLIKLLRPGEPRSGFLYIAEFERVCTFLSPVVCDVARFAYWSGWRLGEILALKWSNAREGWASCYSKKNRDTKLAPIDGHLATVMARRESARKGEYVFHRSGKPIKSLRKAWNAACLRAGVEGRVFHDLRRSFCRNAIRAGIDRDTVKRLSGHRSDSVFSRYNIQDERDLLDAARRLGEM